jgi:hypothetical protein
MDDDDDDDDNIKRVWPTWVAQGARQQQASIHKQLEVRCVKLCECVCQLRLPKV